MVSTLPELLNLQLSGFIILQKLFKFLIILILRKTKYDWITKLQTYQSRNFMRVNTKFSNGFHIINLSTIHKFHDQQLWGT